METQNNVGVVPEDAPMLSFANSPQPKTNLPISVAELKKQVESQVIDMSTIVDFNALNAQPSFAAATVQGAPSITEMARALAGSATGATAVGQIFEFVYNNIEWEPGWGVYRGALGCLMDGMGNAFDQSLLLANLLRSAGFTANIVMGEITLSTAQVTNWFGTNDIFSSANYCGNQQIPFTNLVPPFTSLTLGHVWVQVVISGTTYVLDPAFKQYTRTAGLGSATLATALGYNAATFLTNAQSGATVDVGGDFVQNMNRTNVRNDLKTMTANLVSYINSNTIGSAAPGTATVEDVIGGQTIIPVTLPLTLATVLAYEKVGDVPTVWTGDVDNAYKTTLQVEYLDPTAGFAATINQTFFTDTLAATRLTLFFDGSLVPTLYLNGTALQSGNAQGVGTFTSLRLTINHNGYPVGFFGKSQQAFASGISAGGSYLVGNAWGNLGSGQVTYHQTQLDANIAAGGADTSEPVLGEQLAMTWYTWAAQNSRATDLLGRLTSCHFMYNHQVGVIHYNDGGSGAIGTDFGLINGSPHNLNNNPPEVPKFQVNVAKIGVALEAAVCAQVTGALPGVATTTVVDVANRTAVVTVGGTVTAGNIATLTSNDAALPGGTQAVSYTVVGGDTLTTIATGLANAVNANTNLAGIGETAISVGATVLVSSTSANQTSYTVSATGTLTLAVAFEKLYKGTSANWNAGTTIRNNLLANGYVAGDLSGIDTDITNGYTVLIPERKNQQLGTFTAWGYWEFFPNGFYAAPAGALGIINGAYNGGKGQKNKKPKLPPKLPPKPPGKPVADPVGVFGGSFIISETDIEIGSQEYPYKLSFGREYSSSSQYASGVLGRGWTHSHDFNATVISHGDFAMGEQYAVPACATIANFFVNIDIASDNARPVSKLVTMTLADAWWVDQMANNAVVVSTPKATNQIFIKQPDGSYSRPANNFPNKLTLVSGLFVLTTPQGVKTNFNSAGQISSVVLPNGVTVSYTYTSGKLTSISNGLGRTLTLSYTGANLTSVTDGTGRSVNYTVDVNSNLTVFQDALGQNTTYSYGLPGQITQYFLPAFPATAIVTNVYDSLNRVKTQANTHNQVTTFYLSGPRAEIIDPVGNKEVLYLNSLGSTLREIDALGFETKTVFDGLNRATKVTQPEGNYKQFSFDANDNVLSITTVAKSGSGLANIVENMTYDTTWAKLKTYQDGRGNTTTNSYDPANGNLLTIQRPMVGGLTPTVTMTYNGRGQMLTRSDETSIVTQFNYDVTTEKMTSMVVDFGVSRLNLTTSYGFDAAGNVNSITDPRSNQTTFVFDNLRRMTQRTEATPFGYVTNFGYNANSMLTSTQRQISGSPAFQAYSWTYSAFNLKLTETDPYGRQTVWAYDGEDRMQSITDPQGRVWQFSYDPLNRLNQVTDASNVVSDFRTFTANGKLASIKDSRNNTTQYTWDGFDRANKTTYADTTFEQNSSYDANGNVLTYLTRSGNSIVRTFDALNREATRAPQGQPTVTLTYDLANRLTQVSKPVVAGDPSSGATQFFFDTAGRFFKEQYPDAKTVLNVLDGNGNITKTTWPDAYFVDRVFDSLNRLTDIKLNGSATVAAHFDYNELSQRTQLTYSNGATVVYNPRLNGDLTGITHNFVGSSMSLAYGFNNVAEPIAASATDGSYIWRPAGASSVAYGVADSVNKYPTVGGVAQTYDGNKNLTGDGVWTYGYDTENHMLSAAKTGVSASFVYDPMERQSQKTVGSVKSRYIYSEWQRIADYDGTAGTLQNRYVYGTSMDEPLIQVTSAGVLTFLHADKMGSIIATSNSSGAVTNKNLYSPFGEIATLGGTTFGFTGQRYDSELELSYYKRRMYSPKLGRFLQPDPIGYVTRKGLECGCGCPSEITCSTLELNLYTYVQNSPLVYKDPMGLKPPEPEPEEVAVAGNSGTEECVKRCITLYTIGSRNCLAYDDPQEIVDCLARWGAWVQECIAYC